ncbi:nucleotide sugar dehydrogenase [Cohnella caldifontis]|uniref:nucleotide sugar dehydrogenase n=1 Tax=Cohnella caldifontis TaxID=3027471 RepID=UPI0023EBA837|nr:nucleotide sugar dehydrogenase [Cohnella sp. YIM B05605]
MSNVQPYPYDVGVVGIGRVGLPLALSLAASGLKVVGFDVNPDTVAAVNRKTMPFIEKGCDELIRRVEFEATTDGDRISEAENLIITVGTPLRHHVEADLSQLDVVVEQLSRVLTPGQNVILRSTVAPGTTEFVRRRLEAATGWKVGKDIFLSFCPERIAEGKAIEELTTLPQIVGAQDEGSFRRAASVFERLAPEIFRTDYVSAELVKLFNNVSRYVYFAVANQLAVTAEQFGASIYDVLEMANRGYPRKIHGLPGFTAGTCLRKDFGMLNEANPYSDLFLNAWKINESMPKFLVDRMKARVSLHGARIAILGYTFKQDTDDTRDSLVPKLYRYLKREVPAEIRIHEPFLPRIVEDRWNDLRFENRTMEDAVAGADAVFVAANHLAFRDGFAEIAATLKEGAWISDLWNVSGTGRMFYQKAKKERETGEEHPGDGRERVYRLFPSETAGGQRMPGAGAG